MHKVDIPQYIQDRVKAQRGGLNVFERLDARSTALLVVDLQNAFMLPGMQWEIPYARELVAPVNRLAAATRKAGGRVVWLQMCLEHEAERWSVYFDFIRRGKDKVHDIKTLSRGVRGTPCMRTSTCGRTISGSRRHATAPSSRALPTSTLFCGKLE